ncbi:flavodoxin family protein [Stieleria varia]|uniref:NADPH-dependent FMN reductase n=1 Tax=Stieleria varia TaxID=2528005 RepID=A0A5C6A3A3_9BACT|nr:NAD(P)H-dependent oxidoreductase [Stieleria varia]TWT93845.1 NADPH-dependent FMN reductase [Stieleria varia]
MPGRFGYASPASVLLSFSLLPPSPAMFPKCLLVNGSARPTEGNSAALLSQFERFADGFECRTLDLLHADSLGKAMSELDWADAFVFATGTYWDSWGWPLQRFLEYATATEGTSTWLGKPAAVLVSMHSVGGKSVLSRLQGVLNTLGVVIPPMSGCVLSAVGQAALKSSSPQILGDIWCIEDLRVVAANLRCVCEGRRDFKAWNVDRADFTQRWVDL